MATRPRRRAKWSKPVWIRGTEYRIVNVGDAPAYDVVFGTNNDQDLDWVTGWPAGRVPLIEKGCVPPGGRLDFEVQVSMVGLPDRPARLKESEAGWPPVFAVVSLSWNDVRGWKPASEQEAVSDTPGTVWPVRAHRQAQALPPNRLPRTRSAERPPDDRAWEQLVQFERILNMWLESTDRLDRKLGELEGDTQTAQELFSKEPEAHMRALGELRRSLDQPTLVAFITADMLEQHARAVTQLCSEQAQRDIDSRRNKLRSSFPFMVHINIIRNYLLHHRLFDWSAQFSYSDSKLSIMLNLEPILDWARVGAKHRTEVSIVKFASFVEEYEDRSRRTQIPLRQWVDYMICGNRELMCLVYAEVLNSLDGSFEGG